MRHAAFSEVCLSSVPVVSAGNPMEILIVSLIFIVMHRIFVLRLGKFGIISFFICFWPVDLLVL